MSMTAAAQEAKNYFSIELYGSDALCCSSADQRAFTVVRRQCAGKRSN